MHGKSVPEIDAEYTDFFGDVQKAKNNTRPCKRPLDKEEVLKLAWASELGAITWSKFCHWLPLDFVRGVGAAPPQVEEAAGPLDLREARRGHAIALACCGVGMTAAREAGPGSHCSFSTTSAGPCCLRKEIVQHLSGLPC